MTYEVIVDSVSREEWEEYAANFADYSIYQTWPYQQVRAEMDGQEVSRVIIKDERGHVVTMSQIRIKRVKPLGLRIGYVQWGPLLRGKDGRLNCTTMALDKLREFYLGTKVNILRVVPNVYAEEESFVDMFQAAGFEYVRSVAPYHTMLFPLDISQEEMRNRLHRKWRSVLRKAEKRNIEIKEGCDDKYLAILEELYISAKKRKKFKGLDLQSYVRTQQLLLPQQKINVVLAFCEGEPLTADATSYLGDTAVGLFQASTEKGLQYGTSYLVWWKALLAAQRAGMKKYDMGGVDPVGNPNVYQFKLRMGGEDTFYIGAFEATTNTIIKNMWHTGEKIYRLMK